MQLNDTWMTFKLTGARIMEKVILNYKGEQHELTTDKVPEIGTSNVSAMQVGQTILSSIPGCLPRI